MDALIDLVADFIRVRQLNIAVAALLTLIYLIYQYRGILFKGQDDEEDEPLTRGRSRSRSVCKLTRPRSRSRSCSRDRARNYDYKYRRAKKTRRCPNCTPYSYCD